MLSAPITIYFVTASLKSQLYNKHNNNNNNNNNNNEVYTYKGKTNVDQFW